MTNSLFFKSDEIGSRGRGLTFDDVCLVPKFSEMSSRRQPNLKSLVSKSYWIELPIISANMDTISEHQMCQKMAELGALGILHRFMSVEKQVDELLKVSSFQKERGIKTPLAASIGVKEDAIHRAERLVEAGVNILTVDIAHGDSIMMLETLHFIKKKFPQVDVIAGNVATPQAVKMLIENGADAVKVGIGPGSMCTTRIITGCGVPQLTAIALCSQMAKKYEIPIIADGGLKTSGDIVKALVAGASTVMVGSMIAGTLETPGEMQGGQKIYRGMASKQAQVSWRGELPVGMAAEGESAKVACKGSVVDVISEISGGIRSGMTYLNLNSLEERDLRDEIEFVEMSFAGLSESGPHGVKKG